MIALSERSPEATQPPHGAGLGVALRAARNARRLSLAQVAEATGVSRSLLSLIETGRSDITIGRLSRLARLYDVRLADLVPEPRHPDPLVVRSAGRPMHCPADGVDGEILIPGGRPAREAHRTRRSPRAAVRGDGKPPHAI